MSVCCIATYCLLSCTKKTELSHLEGFAQGTTYHISFDLKNLAEQQVISNEITNELNRLDAAISNYRDDSAIEQFNAQLNTEPQTTTAEIVDLIELARDVSKASHA